MEEFQILFQETDSGEVFEISQTVLNFSIETTIEPQPGKCTMSVINNPDIKFSRGSKITIRQNDNPIFFGYVFDAKYSKSNIVALTIYDSLRYLKNVATYVLKGKTAEQIFKELCADFNVKSKVVDSCSWEVSPRIHDNKTIFEIIQFGLDECLVFTNEWYILRDNVGTVELVNLKNLKTNYYIGDTSALTDYSFNASIDDDTYNQIKLVKENKETAKRDVYVVKDSKNIARWGLLQYYENVDENMDEKQIEKMANDLLKVKNRETMKMSLSVQGALFDIRAGSGIIIDIDELKNSGFKGKHEFVVSRCIHQIEENDKTMKLEILSTSLEIGQ